MPDLTTNLPPVTRLTDLADDIIERVTRAFEGARDPEKGPAMKAYMRDQFAFLGISSPARVALGRDAIVGTAEPTEADLIAVSHALWTKPEREFQYFAAWYLRRHQKILTAEFIDTARHLITTKPWWDTIDELAQNVIGPLVLRDRALVAVMDTWIEDNDFWLARAAILHQNRWRAETDAERLFRYCTRREADTEFFIRKAIGWALREYTRVDPDAVRRFVREHDTTLSGLSKREALKWLDRR